MVGIGLLMIATGLFGAFLWWRGKLFTTRWYLRIVQHGWWLGFVAMLCGWITTEVGRQPWIAYGILRTADAISPVSAASVLTTLVLFVIVYGIVFSMGIYYINRLIVRGPQGTAIEPPHAAPGRPLVGRERCGARSDAGGRLTMEWYLPVIWAGLIGAAVALYVILDGFDLGIGILFPFAKEDKEKRPDDRLDRAVLGRQRDLAGARRRRIVGRVPARLCGDHAGALPAGDRDAARAGVPRRRVRVPHRRGDQQEILEFRLRGRLDARGVLPGPDPRRADPGHQGRERRVRGRRVRLRDAVRAAVRRSASSPATRCSAPAGW